ncbi:orotate phosphoribosyltransferase [Patescibacteria group bacterium]|nr:orotate phosphoribosyltransferase [Patescibacteria group bacterium]
MAQKVTLTPAERFIKYALFIGALELIPEGRKLKSGRISPYFFNSGFFNTAERITSLARAYVAATYNLPCDVVFGPAYKGIPLAVAVAQAVGGNTGYAFNRKEEKDHGEGGMVIGAPLDGKRVLIVDDVITDGGTKREAMEFVQKHRGTPVGLAIACDRQERGKDSKLSAVQEFQNTFGIPVFAAATLADLISYLKKTCDAYDRGETSERPYAAYAQTLEYQKQYGAV